MTPGYSASKVVIRVSICKGTHHVKDEPRNRAFGTQITQILHTAKLFFLAAMGCWQRTCPRLRHSSEASPIEVGRRTLNCQGLHLTDHRRTCPITGPYEKKIYPLCSAPSSYCGGRHVRYIGHPHLYTLSVGLCLHTASGTGHPDVVKRGMYLMRRTVKTKL